MILFLLKSTISLALLLALYYVVLSKESTFKFNRFYLLFALVFSFSVPLISLPKVIPAIQENSARIWNNLETDQKNEIILNPRAIDSQDYITTENVREADIEIPGAINWALIFAFIYFGGLLVFFIRFGFHLRGFWKLIKSNSKISYSTFTIVLIEKDSLPFAFMDYLFVSKSAYESSEIEDEIITHELAHIDQKHSWDLLALEILRCIFWFNPILLLYKKAIQLNHEFLADEVVNTTFNDIASYQWLLYSKVQNFNSNFPLCSPFNYSVTAKRLKIMGSKTYPVKAALLKSISLMMFIGVVFTLSPIKNSLAISLPFMDSNPETYESIISAAYDENQPFKVELNKLDLVALRKAYEGLSDVERGKVTEFPFFDDASFSRLEALQKISDKVKVAMQYNTPPPTKQVKAEIWEYWKKNKNVALEIDEETQDIFVLESYTPEDFALYEVRESEAKGFLKKPSYIIKLTTPEEYQRKYLMPKREIQILIAEFGNGDRAEAYYFMKYINKYANQANPEVEPYIPENFEASVLDAFLNFSPSDYRKSDMILKTDLEKEIPLSIVINGERKNVFVPIVGDGVREPDNRSKITVVGWSN